MIILFPYIEMCRTSIKHIKKNLTKKNPLFKIDAVETGYLKKRGVRSYLFAIIDSS